MSNTVFITGATGNIGGKLLAKILESDPETRIIALIRDKSTSTARQRLAHTVSTLSPEFDAALLDHRVSIVCGDITEHLFGLSDFTFDRIAQKVTHIIHSAAAIQFTLPLECARQVNFVGTVNVMHLAQRAVEIGNLQKVAHISTAYVCGDRAGLIRENDTEEPTRFSNTYEQTKYEAEQYVRTLMPTLPITILRPSIVVGDSHTGRTLTFNVLYSPLKLIYKGLIRTLTCDPATPLDVVPLDYVADAIHHITFHTNSSGRTCHIVAGGNNAPAVGSIVRRFVDYVMNCGTGCNAIAEQLGSQETRQPITSSRTLQIMSVFDPYLRVTRCFDNANTLAALEGSGIVQPAFAGYFHKLMDYCFTVDWGRTLRHAA
jgi:thioester reductase-like protein